MKTISPVQAASAATHPVVAVTPAIRTGGVAPSWRRTSLWWATGAVVLLTGVASAAYFAGRSAQPTSADLAAAMPSAAQAGAGLAGSGRVASPPGAAAPGGNVRETAAPAAPSCRQCGVVESVQAVRRKGDGSGVGAVAGGVVGGALGNQMGAGSGRTAMTVLGAVAGGVAGNEIEKRARAVTVYQVRVRLDNGEVRTLERNQAPAAGQRVRLDGSRLHVLPAERTTATQ